MSGFMFGLTLGVLGALLLGTKEGRKITKEFLNSLPEDVHRLKNIESKENIPDFAPPSEDFPETTPHHAVAEAPPPPPPTTDAKPDYLYHTK